MAGKKSSAKEVNVAETVESGVYVFPNGDKYEGNYRLSLNGVIERHGRGVYFSSDGTTYSGEWVNDSMSGEGKIVYSSGAIYEGGLFNNCYNGHGRYSWPNGSSLTANFKDIKLDGHGEFIDTTGKVWKGLFNGRHAPGLRVKQS
ncbi:MORN repeat-containing protein 2-like [Corticium candelabrum]|uniref:MORN repeat-containing protein 2-like n=1 Tax=Corticium candelabrum TaxID=121492 RepID=UPI002E2EBB61|nr:MORN repeat-containing protein 2-like [Corticium candelabrum]